MTVKTKLFLSWFSFGLTFIAILSLQHVLLRKQGDRLNWFLTAEGPASDASFELQNAYSDEVRSIQAYLYGAENADVAEQDIESAESRIFQSLKILRGIAAVVDPAALNSLETLIHEEAGLKQKLFALKKSGKLEALHAGLKELDALFDRMSMTLGELQNRLSYLKNEVHHEALRDQSRGARYLAFATAIAFLVSLLLALFFSKLIGGPIERLSQVFERIEKGDYSVRAQVESGDQVGRLAVVFNRMIDSILNAQAALSHSAKMSGLGEMAGDIAHEINNPLAIIRGRIGLMKQSLATGTFEQEKFKSDLEKVEFTATRIAKIIKGLLSFSRRSESDPMVRASVSQIVEDVLILSNERFKRSSVELRVGGKTDATLECRPSQISQILMNLIGNAFDAVDQLQEKWIALDFRDSADSIIITVTDSGKGIPPDVVERMMQPFFTTKQAGRGTGLGLSISKNLAEAHHGQLRYDAESENTRFSLELPRCQPRPVIN